MTNRMALLAGAAAATASLLVAFVRISRVEEVEEKDPAQALHDAAENQDVLVVLASKQRHALIEAGFPEDIANHMAGMLYLSMIQG